MIELKYFKILQAYTMFRFIRHVLQCHSIHQDNTYILLLLIHLMEQIICIDFIFLQELFITQQVILHITKILSSLFQHMDTVI